MIDHYTAANFSPLYDVNALAWSDALAPEILPLDRLPKLMWSTDIAGHVTAAAAAETGLAQGTPVTCGTIDAAAEAVSVGVQRPGEMMMMYGSTIFIIQVTSDPVRDPRLWYAPWLWPGMHASMAGLATSGTLTHWFRDHFARDASFGELAAEAAASPKGAKGLICLPYFSGERTPLHDPQAKGAFFGLDLTHTRGDLFRAVLEGVASGTAHVLDTYRELDAFPHRILAVGGGTKNAVWLQATSDISGAGQIVCEKTVGASYGNAFLAATKIRNASFQPALNSSGFDATTHVDSISDFLAKCACLPTKAHLSLVQAIEHISRDLRYISYRIQFVHCLMSAIGNSRNSFVPSLLCLRSNLRASQACDFFKLCVVAQNIDWQFNAKTICGSLCLWIGFGDLSQLSACL